MLSYLRSLNLAFMFLSRLPMPRLAKFEPAEQQRAGLLFPLVGLLLGLILSLFGLFICRYLPAQVAAALLLCLWVFISGGLHIDGLADSADAWLGGLGDRERSLAIMKDPRCGSGAVFTVVVVLLLKYAALSALLQMGQIWFLPPVLLLGRLSALATLSYTPYISSTGSALQFLDLSRRRSINIAVALYCLAFILLLGLDQAWWMLAALIPLWACLRQLMLARLGGSSGDTAGASVELIEAAALTLLCLTEVP
ncbi:MAG: adenosylcobinamide-GDP ribazoletransferase [Cellvibrionaceae bacterium]|nr:adenosylcobinamide-GDP ribazoletransferase [Cellvibrionaceae bacterium]